MIKIAALFGERAVRNLKYNIIEYEGWKIRGCKHKEMVILEMKMAKSDKRCFNKIKVILKRVQE